MSEEKVESKSNKKFNIGYILIIIIVAICSFYVGSITTNNKYSYSVKYTSIEFDNNCTYAYFEINSVSNNSINIKATDFSVKVGNNPITANYIMHGMYGEFDYSVKNETIKIQFDISKDYLDNPITFYYKGKVLALGKEIKF